MKKTINSRFFFFVLMLAAFIAAICAAIFTLMRTMTASALETPKYELTVNYEDIIYTTQSENRYYKETKTGTALGYAGCHMYLWADSYNTSRVSLSEGQQYFGYSNVHIEITNSLIGGMAHIVDPEGAWLFYESVGSSKVFEFSTWDEGKYEVCQVMDNFYHTYTVSAYFYIDRTPPRVVLSNSFANSVSVFFDDDSGISSAAYSRTTSSTYPSSASTSFSNNTTFTEEGNYTVKVTDKAGNVTTKQFTVDKTAPTLTLEGVSNGGFTKNTASAKWTTTAGGVGSQRMNTNDTLTVKYSISTTSSFPTSATTSYSSGTVLSEEGNYLMTISDSAGNTSSYTFTIDKTAPTLSLSGVSNGGFTNSNVSASWSTSISGKGAQRTNSSDALTVKYSISTTSSFPTSATTSYSSGTSLSSEGNYLITISDSAGNTNSYTFTIDKTAPTLSLSGVSDGGFTNGNVSASWSKTIGGKGAQLTNNNDELKAYYTCGTGADFPTRATTAYTANVALVAEGNYRIELTDKAGNSSFLVFTIDKTAPTLSLNTSDSSSFINGRTAKDVSATWGTLAAGKGSQRTNSSDALTVKYSMSTTSSFPTSATDNYTSGQWLNTEGKYRIEISDKAGNVYYQTFEIYRQPPTFTVLAASGEELSQDPLAYNKDIKITFTGCTARLNSSTYTSGTLITAEGDYSFVLTDELGNRTTVTIYIIKHAPDANLKRLKSPLNRWYETTDTTGKKYSFADYDNAYNVASARENAVITSGVWTENFYYEIAPEDISIAQKGMAYFLYKSYDSSAKIHAYFSVATLNKSIEKYILSSIEVKYIPSIPTDAAEGENVYRDIYFNNNAITFNRIANCSLFIDGIERSYPFILTEQGQHTIFEIDIAGNSVTYTVIIDTAKPIVRVSDLTGNNAKALNYGTPYYFQYGIRLYLDDADEYAILRIKSNGEEQVYLGGVIELRAAGSYTIQTRDAAGNADEITISISLIAPTISITENVVVGDIVNSFNVNIEKNYSLNTITNLSIMRWNEEEEEWEALSSDNSSPSVSINRNTLSYLFNVSGRYLIKIVDVFGRDDLEKEYVFVQGAPKGILSTTGGTVLNSGDSTKNNFYFTWSNLLDCSAEISVNGSDFTPYAKGTIITAEGSYTLKLSSNVNDTYNIYEITIDKTAPVGVLTANGAELPNGSTTRFAVSLTWEEKGCTATLNGEPYANGSDVSEEGDYTIELSDKAGNKRTYTFRVKTTPPKIVLTTSMGKISNYDVTRFDVYVSWTERNCTCVVNGANYTQNTKINVENSYTVVLTDAYGNTSSYFFTIDKTAPTGQLFVDGQEVSTSTMIYTNKKVYFTWSELGCSAVINDDFIYNSGSVISEDGTYIIKLSDKAGNVASYSFTIKTSPPAAKLLTNGAEVQSGARTRYEVRLTWSESGCTATVNGTSYEKGAMITAEGDYSFELFDRYGNSNSWQITIDKTPPVITLTSNGEYVNDGDIVRFDVSYTWDDLKATATLNGEPVEIGGVAEEEGEYTLIVVDDVGNKSTIVFIIDKTAKLGTLIANSKILESGSLTRYSAYYTWNGSSYVVTLNGEPYSKGTLITDEGDYRIELTDKAGNVSVVTFTIDKTPPEGILYEVKDETAYNKESGFATNGDVYFEWEEEGCSATLNGEPYSKGTLITDEGDYRIELTDKAGNVSVVTFTIDKTPPKARAYNAANQALDDNAVTRYSIYFEWSESGCTATVNGEPYSKSALITETGVYTFSLTDAVGNETIITIEVYKTIPTFEIVPENDFILPYLNDGFSVIWEEEGCSATLNGEPYESGTLITDEGNYVFVLINKVGTETSASIIIDRTPPEIKVYDADGKVITEEIALSYIYFEWSESGCTALLNGEPYKAKTIITKDGVYSIIVTDAAGNVSSCTVRVARTKPTLQFLKEDGSELNNGGTTSSKITIVSTTLGQATITVDGEEYTSDTVIEEAGLHIVVITNEYGNSAEYSFTIKETRAENSSSNPLGDISKGSSVGTYILIAIIVAVAIILIVVPLIRSKSKNHFKNKLK